MKLSQNNIFLKTQFEERNLKIHNHHFHSKTYKNILSNSPSILHLISLSSLSVIRSFRGTKFLQFQIYLSEFFKNFFYLLLYR